MPWLPETWESGRVEQLEAKFEKGVWLGICPRTDEAIIGVGGMIVRARTVKRQTIEEARSAEDLLAVIVTPWKTGKLIATHVLTVQDGTEIEVVKEDRAENERDANHED